MTTTLFQRPETSPAGAWSRRPPRPALDSARPLAATAEPGALTDEKISDHLRWVPHDSTHFFLELFDLVGHADLVIDWFGRSATVTWFDAPDRPQTEALDVLLEEAVDRLRTTHGPARR